MTDYIELNEENDEEQKLKKRIQKRKERSKDIVDERLKKDPHYKVQNFSCFAKIKLDLKNHINYVYTNKIKGTVFFFLFMCFFIWFPLTSYFTLHHLYRFALTPSIILFIYHLVIAIMSYNVYLSGFFIVQLAIQVLMIFYPDHFIAYSIFSLLFTTIHLFISANLLDLRFYLRVCIIYGLAYIGIAMNLTYTFNVQQFFLFYYSIFLAVVMLIICKITIFQFFFLWLPRAISLFFRVTCLKPEMNFDHKNQYLRDRKYIMKGIID